MSPHAATLPAPTFVITPQSPTIGAEVSGIDLRQEQSADTIAGLRAALVQWKVLFFRGQDITTEQHLAFGRRFGELEVHPFTKPKPGYPEVLALTHDADAPGRENGWHSDVTWRLQPSLGSILLNRECPDISGDTLFADMEAAYAGLPDAMKDRIDGLVAMHDFESFRQRLRKKGATDAEIAAFNERFPDAFHPVVRTHPESGRRSIYVNGAFTKHIVGMEPTESAELLATLYQRASVPEYQCRFRWQQYSIAFWDNRSCQHYACSDYWPNRRCAERVTIIGDTPYFDPAGPRQLPDPRYKGRLEAYRSGGPSPY